MLKIKGKKAYYYTLDAFIALVVILAVILVIKPVTKQETIQVEIQNDLLSILSTLKTNEINNSYVSQLLAENKASGNLTILEQIIEFYAKGMPEAETLTENILSELSPENNIGIWFDDELIASYNTTPIEQAEQIWI